MNRAGVWFLLCAPLLASAQEAESGFEIHGTLTGLVAYNRSVADPLSQGSPVRGEFRGLLYPSWKLSNHWSLESAFQLESRPYLTDRFAGQGYNLKATIVQAQLIYSLVRADRALTIRLGQLTTAFGAFPLRYDDATNPLAGIPPSYGYYGSGVTLGGLAGVQMDGSLGKFDVRLQFVNSSPANPRSVFARDQYGSWAGGAGYTIRQGLRVGVSGFRGPYLDRHSAFYFPGEARPRDLPGRGLGLDVEWAHGPWNAYGEAQAFKFDYKAIPIFRQDTGYGELKRVLSPRIYLAARVSYMRVHVAPTYRIYESTLGYRPNRYQIVKVGYLLTERNAFQTLDHILVCELVTSFRPYSIAR